MYTRPLAVPLTIARSVGCAAFCVGTAVRKSDVRRLIVSPDDALKRSTERVMFPHMKVSSEEGSHGALKGTSQRPVCERKVGGVGARV